MATYFDAYGNPIKPKSSGLILPLVVLVLASGGTNYWLWKERAKTSAQAFEATAKLAATEAMQKEMAEKIQKFDAEKAELVEARDQAVKDAKEKSLELAKLKDDVAGVEVTEPEKEGAADDKGKAGAKGKDAKDAKETPSKTDKKPEPKSKAKAKPKKKTSETSRKKEPSKDNVEREL